MTKKIAILQSNYLPWKGYFDIIAAVDVFVFMDNVQYTRRDWRNRNKVKTVNGFHWLTVPCGSSVSRMICDVEISGTQWQKKHYNSLCHAYSKAPYFERFVDFLRAVYIDTEWRKLSDLNQFLISSIARNFLSINTTFADNGNLPDDLDSNQRLLSIAQSHGAQTYLSGPAAKDYLDVSAFERCGIEVRWMDYSDYREYPQMHGQFQHQVCILDLLFHCGERAKDYLKCASSEN